MWAVVIIVSSPFFDDIAGVAVTGKQVFVQTFIPQPAVEALDKAILHRKRCPKNPVQRQLCEGTTAVQDRRHSAHQAPVMKDRPHQPAVNNPILLPAPKTG